MGQQKSSPQRLVRSSGHEDTLEDQHRLLETNAKSWKQNLEHQFPKKLGLQAISSVLLEHDAESELVEKEALNSWQDEAEEARMNAISDEELWTKEKEVRRKSSPS